MASSVKLREDENTFIRRLLYDGHGTGEDKRLVSLMKNISKFCLSEDQPSSQDNPAKLYNIISEYIAAAIHVAERNEKISHMYDRTFDNLEQRIEEEAQCLINLKLYLKNLELELKYVEKLKKIQEFPSSLTTEKTMAEFERRKQEMYLKLDKLGNELKLLTEACKNLQRILDGDKPTQECVNLSTDSDVNMVVT